MIDHVLGRPSVQFRKIQVLAVVSFWSFYLHRCVHLNYLLLISLLTPHRGDRHGPPLLRRISSLLTSRLTAWQTVLITLLYLYVARNFGKLVGLECPEPLASLYSRSYFRATWVTTAPSLPFELRGDALPTLDLAAAADPTRYARSVLCQRDLSGPPVCGECGRRARSASPGPRAAATRSPWWGGCTSTGPSAP